MIKHHYNLGTLFAEVAVTHATDPALRLPDATWTFARLDECADRIAVRLLAEGLARGDVVAIAHTKEPQSYAAMLAALRLGLPYVNLDVESPLARLESIVNVSGARCILVEDAIEAPMRELAALRGTSVLQFKRIIETPVAAEDWETIYRRSALVDGATIAYIMFTSGSTGVPKGVAVSHQNVLHLIEWGRTRFAIGAGDVFANVSPMYFDNSVFDFYVGLFSGACLAPVKREVTTSPYDLVRHVGDMGCTVWFSVPSLLIYLVTMKAFGPGVMRSLRWIVFGGEGYPKVELKKLYDRFGRDAQLVNVYGPTECTCICSAHTITPQDLEDLTGLPTLGCLNPNFDYRIVDENGAEATEGELCLMGPNVASGYFNDPERTAESFQTLTDAGRYGKRMYRTGDLVREEAGKLWFVARKDNQVKHMGYRIELEEIEHALAKLPGVTRAAVIYVRESTAFGKIIGFVSADGAIDDKVLLREVANLVPRYMVPSRLVVMPALPTNANGKIDRRQLRAQLER